MNVPLAAYANGGSEAPTAGDLLIYKSTPGQRVGHVAVVISSSRLDATTFLHQTSFLQVLSVSIVPGGVSHVRVGEQNQENDIMWPGDYADQIELKVNTAQLSMN